MPSVATGHTGVRSMKEMVQTGGDDLEEPLENSARSIADTGTIHTYPCACRTRITCGHTHHPPYATTTDNVWTTMYTHSRHCSPYTPSIL